MNTLSNLIKESLLNENSNITLNSLAQKINSTNQIEDINNALNDLFLSIIKDKVEDQIKKLYSNAVTTIDGEYVQVVIDNIIIDIFLNSTKRKIDYSCALVNDKNVYENSPSASTNVDGLIKKIPGSIKKLQQKISK